MKNKIGLLFTLALFLFGSKSFSQTEKGQTVISASYGFSAVRGVVKTLWLADLIEASVNGIGTAAAGVDYGLTNKFSIGANYATQSISGTATNVDWFLFSDTSNHIETFNYAMRRTHISITPKIHYITDNEKLDIYSGLRIGYVIWNKKFESKDPGFPENYNLAMNTLKNRVSVGIIALGARYYFNPNFGASIELNVGPPYIFSIGAVYKIGGGE